MKKKEKQINRRVMLAEGLALEEQYQLGLCYEYGVGGVAKDYTKAFQLVKAAAEAGLVEAQNHLPIFYLHGLGVDKNFAEVFRWHLMAAEQGLADAQFNVSGCYRMGCGVERDFRQAFLWAKKAVEQGHVGAKFALGSAYLSGQGTERNMTLAVQLIVEAAKEGEPSAISFIKQCSNMLENPKLSMFKPLHNR